MLQATGLQRVMGLTAANYVPAPVIALPVAPQLTSALCFIALHSLPILLLFRLALRRRTPFAPGFWFLVLVYAYAGAMSSLGEYSENMRYRLEVEPIIWVLSAVIAREWIAAVRCLAERSSGLSRRAWT